MGTLLGLQGIDYLEKAVYFHFIAARSGTKICLKNAGAYSVRTVY